MNLGPRLLLYLSLALFSGGAHAIFKCTDAKGNVTYSGTPCPTTTSEKALESPARPPGSARVVQDFDELMANPDLSEDQRQSAAAARIAASKKIGEASPEQAEACLARNRSRIADPTAAYLLASGIYRYSAGETFVAVNVSVRDTGSGVDRMSFLCTLPK